MDPLEKTLPPKCGRKESNHEQVFKNSIFKGAEIKRYRSNQRIDPREYLETWKNHRNEQQKPGFQTNTLCNTHSYIYFLWNETNRNQTLNSTTLVLKQRKSLLTKLQK